MKLTREFLSKWLENLKSAWMEKDLEKIKSIFLKIQNYYEDPFSDPGKSVDEVVEFWKEIKNQEIKNLTFKIVAVEKNIGVVDWKFEDKTGIYKGLYVIYFNSNLNCIEFRQWCSEK